MADGTSWSQPSLSLRARPISACVAPFPPGQNLNTSAIPAPPSLIPQPSPPCLPTYLLTTSALLALLCPLCLLLLFSACLALSFPGHFIRDGGGNQQLAIVPSEPNTNITSSFSGAVQRLPLVQVTFRFFSCARFEPQLHCCTVVALVPPGLSYLRHPSSARPAPFVRPYLSPNARSPPHNPSRSPRAGWGLRSPRESRPNNHHLTSASDQRHLDTICGGRARSKEKGGTQGCGAETWGLATKIVRRPDEQKVARADPNSSAQPSHSPLGKGGAGPRVF